MSTKKNIHLFKIIISYLTENGSIPKKASKQSELKSNDFDNLLSEENLIFLLRMLTTSLVDTANHIESGIDDFKMTFRIPIDWQEDIIDKLNCHPEIKESNHFGHTGYNPRYGISNKAWTPLKPRHGRL